MRKSPAPKHTSPYFVGFCFFSLIALILLSIVMYTGTASAATTASVAATVTVQNISLTVTDGTVAYGTLAVNTSAGTNGSDTQTATNNGNVTEDILVRGQDTAAWTLAATSGVDQSVHRFCTATCTTPPTNYTALTTSNQNLKTGLAASGTQTFDLYVTTPTSSSSFTQQSVDVTLTAVAS